MSSSILTNNGAMVALQSLNATQNALTMTESQISTGLKVQTAEDDSAAWSISTTMKTNISSLNQIGTDLGNADSALGTAVSGADQITSLLSQIRTKVETAASPDDQTSISDIQGEVDQLLNQINSTVQSSSFNGVNLLDGSTTSKLGNGDSGLAFLAATANSYAGTSGTQSTYIDVDTKNSNLTTAGGTVAAGVGAGTGSALQNLFNLLGDASTGNSATAGVGAVYAAANGTAATDQYYTAAQAGTYTNDKGATVNVAVGQLYSATAANAQVGDVAVTTDAGGLQGIADAINANPNALDAFLNVVDQASQAVQNTAAQFGAVQQNIQSQQTFVSNLSDSLTTGVGNLVDADMTSASARLSALQTQQQLGTQALSIANQAPQALLKLFG
jgi:flagellin